MSMSKKVNQVKLYAIITEEGFIPEVVTRGKDEIIHVYLKEYEDRITAPILIIWGNEFCLCETPVLNYITFLKLVHLVEKLKRLGLKPMNSPSCKTVRVKLE